MYDTFNMWHCFETSAVCVSLIDLLFINPKHVWKGCVDVHVVHDVFPTVFLNLQAYKIVCALKWKYVYKLIWNLGTV